MLSRGLRYKHLSKAFSQLSYSPPDISGVPQNWTATQPPLKEEIIEYLSWEMEDDWKKMSTDEKKAIYHISYGDYGPRSASPAGQISPVYLIWKSLFSGVLFLAVGLSVINIRRDKQMFSEIKQLEERVSSA